MKLNANLIRELIVAGRYAGLCSDKRACDATPTIAGAKRFVFATKVDGINVTYEDECIGESAYQGRQLVKEEEASVWGMVYAGFVLDERAVVEKMLQEILLAEYDRARLGVDFSIKQGGLVYRIRTLQWDSRISFVQTETIRSGTTKLYSLTLVAGAIM